MAQTKAQKVAEAEARLAKARAALRDEQRKADTRRKIILGGLLLDKAARDPAARASVQRMVDSLAREADKAAFAGWTLPEAGPAPAAEPAKVAAPTPEPATTPAPTMPPLPPRRVATPEPSGGGWLGKKG